jgi:MSHA pilin protein MshC
LRLWEIKEELGLRADLIVRQGNDIGIYSQHHRHAGTPCAAPKFCARASVMGDRGFTLAELVMVLVLVGILAFFALPRLDFQSAFGERGFHDRLKAGLQFARKAAVAQRRYVCVSVTSGVGGKVTFTIDNSLPENASGCTAPLTLPAADTTSGCATSEICAGSSLSVSADNASFTFDPAGRMTAASKVTFTSTGQPPITVENETGYVH